MDEFTNRKCLFTRGSDFNGKILGCCITAHLWELVAYYKWLHMEVRLYVTHLLHKAQEFFKSFFLDLVRVA